MKHTKESLMEQAQVFASAWSLVGGPFDSGDALDVASEAKKELSDMIGEVMRQRDELLSALLSLEQAYSNSHSPQHRSACLIEARAIIAKAEAA